MKPVTILSALVIFGVTPLIAAADAGQFKGEDRVVNGGEFSGAMGSAPMSRLQLADNDDQGACEVTYGNSISCHDSFRWLCKIANYLHSVSTEFHSGETCADIGYK